jgi:HEAT repeat protein
MDHDDDDVAMPDERAIAEQIALLSTCVHAEDIEQRRQAVSQLFDLCYKVRSRAQAAVPILLRCLADPDEKVGESALWGLKWCAPESIEPLIDCLANSNANVRRRACDSLGSIGDEAFSARDSLRQLLTDDAESVRLRAAFALGLIHDTSDLTIDALFAMAHSNTTTDRAAALHALGNIGQALANPEPLRAKQQQILDALEDDDANVRSSACHALESLRLDPPRHVALLISRLADSDPHTRWMATVQLKRLAPVVDLADHVASMCDVVREVGDESAAADDTAATEICKILALIGPKAKSAVPDLIEALRSDRGFLVIAAAEALWKIDRRIEESLPALERLFDEYGETVCDAICEIGPAAGPLMPAVIRALQSEDWDLQWAAADALGAISSSDPQVLAVLGSSLGHPSPIVRRAAAGALVRIGATAVPTLIRLLEDHEDGRSEWAADALGRMGRRANDAVEALRGNLQSSNSELAAWSVIAVAKIAGDAATVPMLIDLLAQADREDLRTEAAVGLKTIGPPAISASDALTRALKDDDAEVRAAAQEALAAINRRTH